MVKSHLAIRTRKRGKNTSDFKQADNSLDEFLLLFYFILTLFLTAISRLKDVIYNYHVGVLYIEGGERRQCKEDGKGFVAEELYGKRAVSVTVRGIGLIAAYSRRRAMFAVYPAVGDGLEVDSEGPEHIQFEYKQKEGMLLVGYVAPRPGRYWLRVSRFGRAALGSPFVLIVEDAPLGYRGNFGTALWYDVPVRPPVLSGIIDFVTEKMYMDEEGNLFKLNKDGSISNERYIVKRGRKPSVAENLTKLDKQTETTNSENDEPCKIVNTDLRKSADPGDIRRENVPKIVVDKYNQANKIIYDELNENIKVLNLLSSKLDSHLENAFKPSSNLVIPKITVTNDEPKENLLTECNLSKEDQFLSELESRYTTRRSEKLERVAGDDAVSSEPCDGRGQIGSLPRGWSGAVTLPVNDAKPVDFISESERSTKTRGKYHPFNIAATLGFSKSHQKLPGISLLHEIYRIDENLQKKVRNPELYQIRVLNNEKIHKKDYANIHKISTRRHLEINNLEIGKASPKVCNTKQSSTTFNEQNTNTKRNGNKFNTRLPKTRYRNSKMSGSFRTLSLPDFSRIYSLSVRGLRKAKSCGDRSFRALSSSSLSLSIRNLFEKDQVYHLNKKTHPRGVKYSKETATLVRIAHYGSGKDTKKIETGTRSVDEWKKYWESESFKKAREVERGCSLEIKGIVTKGKETFETIIEQDCHERISLQMSRENSPKNEIDSKIKIKEDNKTAFQKAKEIFEGDFTSMDDLTDPQYRRKKSIAERFHISSLSKDIYAGVTPEHLGIPNRVPVVESLGSIYHPTYPHLPVTPSRKNSSPCNDLLFSDPNYV